MEICEAAQPLIYVRKTLKKKNPLNHLQKSKLWDIYDQDKISLTVGVPSTSTVEQTEFCVKCHTLMICADEGFQTCPNGVCGYMNNYILDYSPEWRYFAGDKKSNNADTTRCGNPIDPLLEESSYACKIFCTSNASIEMKNLRKWSRWQSMPHKEKMLHEEFQLISTYASNAGIPKIFIDDAKAIFKDLYEQKNFRGMKRDAMRAACIWIACWKNKCPRTSNEIADIFHIDKNSASLGCSCAEELLQSHERTMDVSDKSKLCALTPSAFIERFSSKLELSPDQQLLAKFIAFQVEKKELIPDNRPQAIAAGILYFVSQYCQLPYTKMDIKLKLGDEASEVTINKCFKKLNDYKKELLPSWVIQKYGKAGDNVLC
jgi:transcription initiation factor TFIIIB Brf1 subunit/transcription initiation factor TFIIB